MPLFRSTASVPIQFDAGETRFVVPAGAAVEIERRYEYIPAARGLPLVQIERSSLAKDEPVIEGSDAPKPKRTRVRGVASGQTVLESDDGDDRVGEPISEARASLVALAEGAVVGDDSEADGEPVALPTVVAKAARARRGE